ncbi:MAG: protein phosphatase 1 regulatory subunit 42 [Defluviitaleaceae bacterium]|nr:protein phosphatase 1 regulatory subunit 42 [Defluviitaleaceae bacterium]
MRRRHFFVLTFFLLFLAAATLPAHILIYADTECENFNCDDDDCDGENCVEEDTPAADPNDLTYAFLCPVFRAAIRDELNHKEENGNYPPIYQEDLNRITRLSLYGGEMERLHGTRIRSLAGVEHLTNLEYLKVDSNYLIPFDEETGTGIDVSQNEKLTELNVHNNFISSPDEVKGWRDGFHIGSGVARTDVPRPPYPMPAPGITPPPHSEPTTASNEENTAGEEDNYDNEGNRESFGVPIERNHPNEVIRRALRDSTSFEGTVVLSVDVRRESYNSDWVVINASEVPEPGTLYVIFTWVLVVLIFLMFILNLLILIVRSRN